MLSAAGRLDRGKDPRAGGGAVEPVGVAHHAVAEAVRGARELDGDERFPLRGVADALIRVTCGDVRTDDPRQEVVDDGPLVVPADDPLCLAEELTAGETCALLTDMLDDLVVEAYEQQVQLRDDQVLVVARIADQRDLVVVSRQIRVRAVGVAADEKLDAAVLGSARS